MANQLPLSPLQGANLFVAVGSTDGMAGTSACLRRLSLDNIDTTSIKLIFTQAFQVDQLNIAEWEPERKVGIIDLGVNIRDSQMTADFVTKIYELGHQILFIADEHGKKAWQDVLQSCGHDVDELTIQPQDRGDEYGSSCAILREALGKTADGHTNALLEAGDQADRMNFDTHFGSIFNNAIKLKMSDNERRVYLTRHLATNQDPDPKIQGWVDAYAKVKASESLILASRVDSGDDISFYNCEIGPHDATSIFFKAYRNSSVVVLNNVQAVQQNETRTCASIGTNRDDLNLLEITQKAGVSANGMAKKITFQLQDLDEAVNAVRQAIIAKDPVLKEQRDIACVIL